MEDNGSINIAQVNVDVPEDLKRRFKSAVEARGEKVKDVLAAYMREYADGPSENRLTVAEREACANLVSLMRKPNKSATAQRTINHILEDLREWDQY